MIPSTTSSRSNALVLSQFFSPDLIRTFSTSIGMGAPERTCSILSRSVSLDLFGRLNMFLALGLWPGLYPQATTMGQSRTEHMHPVTSQILEQLHEPQSSTYGFRRISAKLLGYSQNTSKPYCRSIYCWLASDGLQRALAFMTSFGCSVDQIVSNIFSCDLTSKGSFVHVATSWPAFTFVLSGMSSRKIISAESALAKCIIGTVMFLTSITSASSLATLAFPWFTGATTFTLAPR